MNLRMITDSTGYFEGPVTVGACYLDGRTVVLIDSGSDDSAARKISARFEKEQVTVKAIINTHSHADHCGGNGLIQKRFGAPVYAVGMEAALIRMPELEPVYLYGAGPHKFMQNKFLQAPPTADVREVPFGALDLDGNSFELMDYSGHSPAMTGVCTPDGVLFLGDALIGPQTADKHGLLYHFDLRAHRKTLETLSHSEHHLCVLSHGGLCTHPADVAADNLERIQAVDDWLISAAATGAGREELLERLLEHRDIFPPPALYYLNLGLVSSHLAHLCEAGLMEVRMEGARLRYHSQKSGIEPAT